MITMMMVVEVLVGIGSTWQLHDDAYRHHRVCSVLYEQLGMAGQQAAIPQQAPGVHRVAACLWHV